MNIVIMNNNIDSSIEPIPYISADIKIHPGLHLFFLRLQSIVIY